jgi:hypothetical protein
MRTLAIVAASLLTVACGDNPIGQAPSSVQPSGALPTPYTASVQPGGKLGARSECAGVTYVGPIRQPISVHGTGVDISWLGNDDAIRGYQLEFQRYDVTNVWVPAFETAVISPEYSGAVRTHGTYRVRVRGLFCNDGTGPWTDYVVFSTDGEPSPSVDLPVIVPPPPPPPPPGDDNGHHGDGNNGNGNGNGGGNGTGNEGNGQGPQDPPGPPDNPGQGNDNPGPPVDPPAGPPVCTLGPQSNGHGNPPPTPGGDHNDDGHNDCGQGNTNPHGN